MRASKSEPILEEKSSSLPLSKSMSIDLKTPQNDTNLRIIKSYIRNRNIKENIKKLFRILKSLTTETYYYKTNILNILKYYKDFIEQFNLFLKQNLNKDDINYIKKLFDIFSYLFKLFEINYSDVQYKKGEYNKLLVEYDNLKALLKKIFKAIHLKQYKLNSIITNKKQIKKILKQNLKYYTSLHIIYSKNTVFEKIFEYLNEINNIMKSHDLDTTYLKLLKKHYENIIIKVLEQYNEISKIQNFLTEFQEIIKDENRFQLFRDNLRQNFINKIK